MGFLELLSAFFGVTYFAAWSVSFYPQSMLNFRRKSTSGTTVDFPLINCLGMPPIILFMFPSRDSILIHTLRVRCLPGLQHSILLLAPDPRPVCRSL